MDFLRKFCYMCNIRCVMTWSFVLAMPLFVAGCLGNGVLYNDKNKSLIVTKNDAILSCFDTVIGEERQVDSIILKKGRDGLVRTVYFKTSKESKLSISEVDFRLDFIERRLSLLSKNKISVLGMNLYDIDKIKTSSIVWDNYGQIVINDADVRRITYFKQRGGLHVIWIDVMLGVEEVAQIAIGISGVENKAPVLLTIERREMCDIVIQENCYEFAVF